jgi:hypothetical protein
MDDIKLYANTYAHLKELYKITEEFSNSIGMEFGMDKCRNQTIIRGQVRVGENIETLSRKTIVPLDEREVYKYLGVLPNGRIDHTAAKLKLKNEFNGRLKKVLHTSLNARQYIHSYQHLLCPSTHVLIRYHKMEYHRHHSA